MSSALDLLDDSASSSPPPPPPLARLPSNNQHAAGRCATGSLINSTEHQWAASHPDVHKACFLARVCAVRPPKACRLLDIPAIQQEGPTCGLTALSMLAGGQPPPAELLAEAQRRQYTRNGEMFSAENLLQLVRHTLGAGPDNEGAAMVWLHCGELCRGDGATTDGEADGDRIKRVLLQGGCLLVPYDADFNHGPCLRKGHRAHWALIIGYLIDDDDQFYVFARHGKTLNIAVWPLHALSQSNANLIEFEKPRQHADAEFELPAGGVGGPLGLRHRCIVIERLCGEAHRDGFGVARIVVR